MNILTGEMTTNLFQWEEDTKSIPEWLPKHFSTLYTVPRGLSLEPHVEAEGDSSTDVFSSSEQIERSKAVNAGLNVAMIGEFALDKQSKKVAKRVQNNFYAIKRQLYKLYSIEFRPGALPTQEVNVADDDTRVVKLHPDFVSAAQALFTGKLNIPLAKPPPLDATPESESESVPEPVSEPAESTSDQTEGEAVSTLQLGEGETSDIEQGELEDEGQVGQVTTEGEEEEEGDVEDDLPDDVVAEGRRFLNRFGTHLLTSGTFGGEMRLEALTAKTEDLEENPRKLGRWFSQFFKVAVDLAGAAAQRALGSQQVNVVSTKQAPADSSEATDKLQAVDENSDFTVDIIGGTKLPLTMKADIDKGSGGMLKDWVTSLWELPVMIEYRLKPITLLFTHPLLKGVEHVEKKIDLLNRILEEMLEEGQELADLELQRDNADEKFHRLLDKLERVRQAPASHEEQKLLSAIDPEAACKTVCTLDSTIAQVTRSVQGELPIPDVEVSTTLADCEEECSHKKRNILFPPEDNEDLSACGFCHRLEHQLWSVKKRKALEKYCKLFADPDSSQNCHLAMGKIRNFLQAWKKQHVSGLLSLRLAASFHRDRLLYQWWMKANSDQDFCTLVGSCQADGTTEQQGSTPSTPSTPSLDRCVLCEGMAAKAIATKELPTNYCEDMAESEKEGCEAVLSDFTRAMKKARGLFSRGGWSKFIEHSGSDKIIGICSMSDFCDKPVTV
eukprot:TRINITY_DN16684_c0_g1_i1.p1 TRINITY_DN16684_c0_g1~~TRINITY_DN16684_c0_g1_i1.p1  ORF type:complete len:772 (+),score=226.36 TRINITY_DN16684_c0_g1_i1:136-2316(+)